MVSFVSDEIAKISKRFFFLMLCLCILSFTCLNSSEAYYGSGLYGGGIYGGYGLGGLYGGLGGLYGMGGLYGSGGLYGGLGGLYGMSSMYGLGGLYGGLGSLYGLGGMYGLYGSGSYGLYGLGGLYGGLGGLYGMSSMYGLGGLYGGLGSLYGLGGGLYGLGTFSGLGGLGGLFGSLNVLSNLGLFNLGGQGTAVAAPVVAAEQAGTWTGVWYSLLKLNSGFMNMTLIEDEIIGALIGEVALILNKYTNSIPAEISGLYDGGSTFVLTGGNNTVFSTTLLLTTAVTLYEIELNCTLTSPTTMTGTYYINDLTKLLGNDYGNFNLTLSAPAI